MRSTLSLPLTAIGLAALAACNSYGAVNDPRVSAQSGRQCFYAANVSGYRSGPNNTVIVNTNSRDYYEFRTQPYCAGRIDWENRIALRSRAGSFICAGYDAEIYVPDALGTSYCPLYDMRKLSPAEVAALRAQRR